MFSTYHCTLHTVPDKIHKTDNSTTTNDNRSTTDNSTTNSTSNTFNISNTVTNTTYNNIWPYASLLSGPNTASPFPLELASTALFHGAPAPENVLFLMRAPSNLSDYSNNSTAPTCSFGILVLTPLLQRSMARTSDLNAPNVTEAAADHPHEPLVLCPTNNYASGKHPNHDPFFSNFNRPLSRKGTATFNKQPASSSNGLFRNSLSRRSTEASLGRTPVSSYTAQILHYLSHFTFLQDIAAVTVIMFTARSLLRSSVQMNGDFSSTVLAFCEQVVGVCREIVVNSAYMGLKGYRDVGGGVRLGLGFRSVCANALFR